MNKLGDRVILPVKAVEKPGCQATFKEHCTFPKCDCDRDFDVLDEDHPNTCRCEVCRFWS